MIKISVVVIESLSFNIDLWKNKDYIGITYI